MLFSLPVESVDDFSRECDRLGTTKTDPANDETDEKQSHQTRLGGLHRIKQIEAKMPELAFSEQFRPVIFPIVVTIIIVVLSVSRSLTIQTALENVSKPISLVRARFDETGAITTLRSSALAYSFSEPESIARLQRSFGYYDYCRNEADEFGLTSKFDLDNYDAMFLKYERNCTDPLIGVCIGMDSLDQIVVKSIRSIGDYPPTQVSSLEFRSVVERINMIALEPWHKSYCSIVISFMFESLDGLFFFFFLSFHFSFSFHLFQHNRKYINWRCHFSCCVPIHCIGDSNGDQNIFNCCEHPKQLCKDSSMFPFECLWSITRNCCIHHHW
jgi:hypothetical protein